MKQGIYCWGYTESISANWKLNCEHALFWDLVQEWWSSEVNGQFSTPALVPSMAVSPLVF